MDNKKFSEIDIVKKIVGEVCPVGETNTDNARFENLKVMCELVDDLLGEIGVVASYDEAHEYSVKRAGEYATDFLKQIKDNL